MKDIIVKTAVLMLLSFLLLPYYVSAQDTIVLGTQKEIRKEKRNLPPQKGDIFIIAMPTVAYNPSNGLLIGIGGAGSFFLGDPKTTCFLVY